MATAQPDRRTIRVLPMNRRKLYLVSFTFTAVWYAVILTVASQPDTNCRIEDCDLWVTVLAWTLFAPLFLVPFACGLSLSPAGTPKRRVRWIISACTSGTGVVALIVFFWIDARNASPGGSVEANTRAFTAGLTFFGLPLCLLAGYLLVGLGGWIGAIAFRRANSVQEIAIASLQIDTRHRSTCVCDGAGEKSSNREIGASAAGATTVGGLLWHLVDEARIEVHRRMMRMRMRMNIAQPHPARKEPSPRIERVIYVPVA